MRGPGDGMASSVGDCSRVSSLSKQESDIFFSLHMTPFRQIHCLPSFNHSIRAPADNGIKMSHAIIIIMSKSLNHTNVCVWLPSVLACNYNQKVWITLAFFPSAAQPLLSVFSSSLKFSMFSLCRHIVLLAHHRVANLFSFSSICQHVQLHYCAIIWQQTLANPISWPLIWILRVDMSKAVTTRRSIFVAIM